MDVGRLLFFNHSLILFYLFISFYIFIFILYTPLKFSLLNKYFFRKKLNNRFSLTERGLFTYLRYHFQFNFLNNKIKYILIHHSCSMCIFNNIDITKRNLGKKIRTKNLSRRIGSIESQLSPYYKSHCFNVAYNLQHLQNITNRPNMIIRLRASKRAHVLATFSRDINSLVRHKFRSSTLNLIRSGNIHTHVHNIYIIQNGRIYKINNSLSSVRSLRDVHMRGPHRNRKIFFC